MPLHPSPPGWPRMSSCVFYRDAAAAIDWLVQAFGFEVRMRIEDDAGVIVHSELEYGDGLVQVGQQGTNNESRAWKSRMRSPLEVQGNNTQAVMFFVDDLETHCAHAARHGARIVEPLTVHDYGEEYWVDRTYAALDLEDHLWWVVQRLRTGTAP